MKRRSYRDFDPEQALQVSVVEWMEACLPPPPEGPWWTAVNPVPAKSKAVAGLSKAMGLRAGVPDIVGSWRVGWHRRKRSALPQPFAIELKAPTGSVSRTQAEVINQMELAGFIVGVCRSVEDVQQFFDIYGVPMRGKVAA